MRHSNRSLESLAASLNEIHSHQQKPSIPITFRNNNPIDKLRPGGFSFEINSLLRIGFDGGRFYFS